MSDDPREIAVEAAKKLLLQENPDARWDDVIAQEYGSHWDVFFIGYPDYTRVRIDMESI